MKHFYTLLSLVLAASGLRAQFYSPSALLNNEILLQDLLIDYNFLRDLDPTTLPTDTLSLLNFERNSNGVLLLGQEVSPVSGDTFSWHAQFANSVNEIDIVQRSTGDTLQKELLHFDSNNDIVRIETYLDTGGALSLIQEIETFHSSQGIDSALVYEFSTGTRQRFASIHVNFNAQGLVDSVYVDATFGGTRFTLQQMDYHYSGLVLDSIQLIDPLAQSVVQLIIPTSNVTGKITAISLYERDLNNEWMPYSIVEFEKNTALSLNTLAGLDFELFPNPVTDFLNVQSSQTTELAIYNLNGQLVKQFAKEDYHKIDLAGLSAGTYILVLKNEEGTLGRTKFVKQ